MFDHLRQADLTISSFRMITSELETIPLLPQAFWSESIQNWCRSPNLPAINLCPLTVTHLMQTLNKIFHFYCNGLHCFLIPCATYGIQMVCKDTVEKYREINKLTASVPPLTSLNSSLTISTFSEGKQVRWYVNSFGKTSIWTSLWYKVISSPSQLWDP